MWYTYRTVEGYDDGDYLQHTKLSALEFIRSENFHQLLANSAEVIIIKVLYCIVANITLS